MNFTGNKDVDIIILNMLDDESLFNFFFAYPNNKAYNNSDFWRNKIRSKYPGSDIDDSINYKEIYIKTNYYLKNYKKEDALYVLSKGGMENINIIKNIMYVIRSDDVMAVIYSYESYEYIKGFEGAVEVECIDLVKFFIKEIDSYCYDCYQSGLSLASYYGHKELVKFFIEDSHYDSFYDEEDVIIFKGIIENAVTRGYNEIANMLIEKLNKIKIDYIF